MEISVIIPYFNSSEFIERTLDSVKKQIYLPKEVIIVDDFSSNSHSLNFINENKLSYPFELVIIRHNENKGAAAARNSGIKVAKYDYIAFLDADDCWVDSKLKNQIELIGNFDLLYSSYSETKDLINDKKNSENVINTKYFQILKKNLSPVTLLVKKTSLVMFDERFRRCDDFKMSIEALATGRKIGFIDLDVAYGFKRAIGGGGLTGSLSKMSFSFIKACLTIIYERPKLIFKITPFIVFEMIKFPIRCLKVFILK